MPDFRCSSCGTINPSLHMIKEILKPQMKMRVILSEPDVEKPDQAKRFVLCITCGERAYEIERY